MKRILTIVSVLSLVVASGAMAEDYGWSLSGSAADATVNTGPAVASTPFSVFLHLECAPFDGISAAEFSMSTNFFDAGFTPLAGALNAGTSVHFQIQFSMINKNLSRRAVSARGT